jgi:hemolysin activation/secretion protein
LTYYGTLRAATSETTFYFGTYDNIPGNKAAGQLAFTASRAGASDWYSLQKFGISHNRSFANDVQVRGSLSGQMTKDLLVSGEQFGIGGADSVRGFAERELAADVGVRGSVELYSPDFASALNLGSEGSSTRVRALTFYDWGRVMRNKATILETQSHTIASAGFGVRIAVGSNLFIRLDFGIVRDPGGSVGRGDGLGHLNMSYLF